MEKIRIAIVCGYGVTVGVRYAKYLDHVFKYCTSFNEKIDLIILCGGVTRKNDRNFSEAEAMNEYLFSIEKLIPKFDVYGDPARRQLPPVTLENYSFTTHENLENALVLAKRNFPENQLEFLIFCRVEKGIHARILADIIFKEYETSVMTFDNLKSGEAEKEFYRLLAKMLIIKVPPLKKIHHWLRKKGFC